MAAPQDMTPRSIASLARDTHCTHTPHRRERSEGKGKDGRIGFAPPGGSEGNKQIIFIYDTTRNGVREKSYVWDGGALGVVAVKVYYYLTFIVL